MRKGKGEKLKKNGKRKRDTPAPRGAILVFTAYGFCAYRTDKISVPQV